MNKPEILENKENKHVGLNDAIDNVESILHRVERLYEKIMEILPEDKPCSEKLKPSLHNVLEGGAKRLYTTTDEIHMTINKIEDVIF
jgi:hypothetical protein